MLQKKLQWVITCSFLLFASTAFASVTLVGTRVIYPEKEKSVSLQFRSPDPVPSIVEVWTTTPGTIDTSSQYANAPFVITPQVFRIEPQKGQTAKLIYTGASLPNDRESLFYLHFTQLPATTKENENKNKLLVSYRSKLKLFFRPSGLTGDPQKVIEQLTIDKKGLSSGRFTVINPSQYHVSFDSITIKQNNKILHVIQGKDLSMITPFDKQEISVKAMRSIPTNAVINIKIVNDLGGISERQIQL